MTRVDTYPACDLSRFMSIPYFDFLHHDKMTPEDAFRKQGMVIVDGVLFTACII